MKPQEVITLFIEMPDQEAGHAENKISVHPELDPYFEKGMYIEKFSQCCSESGKCAITFIFRYYNASQSKIS